MPWWVHTLLYCVRDMGMGLCEHIHICAPAVSSKEPTYLIRPVDALWAKPSTDFEGGRGIGRDDCQRATGTIKQRCLHHNDMLRMTHDQGRVVSCRIVMQCKLTLFGVRHYSDRSVTAGGVLANHERGGGAHSTYRAQSPRERGYVHGGDGKASWGEGAGKAEASQQGIWNTSLFVQGSIFSPWIPYISRDPSGTPHTKRMEARRHLRRQQSVSHHCRLVANTGCLLVNLMVPY